MSGSFLRVRVRPNPQALRPEGARAARSPLPWLGAILALYLLLPLLALATQLASGHVSGFGAPGLWPALEVSVVTASCSTAICAFFGVPLAYSLARSRGLIASIVGAAVLLPLAIPPLMAGILLVSVVGPDTTLGQLFGGRLTDSMAGIVLAQTFVAAPFTIVAARSAFRTVDPSLLDVSATLGMGTWKRFAQVSLPVAASGIGAGLLLTWLRAFGEFGATVIVAYHPYSLPVFTYVQFSGFGLAQATAPTVLALGAAVLILVMTRLRPPRRGRARLASPITPIGAQHLEPIAFALDEQMGSFRLHLTHSAKSPHLAILGPSGAGKTSTLRCIAGLIGRDSNEVRLGSRALHGVPSEQRCLGYVPQEPSLLPRRCVWHQVTLGSHADGGLASYWIQRLGLEGLENRMPEELSGGQRHRVALARALAREPQLLLLDEPFAGLDAPVRDQLRRELRQLLQAGTSASVLVTHDPEEAALLAEEILVIDQGRLLQAGATTEVFAHPATPTVAALLGIVNIHRGRVGISSLIEAGALSLRGNSAVLPPAGTAVWWCVRPEHLRVAFAPDRRQLPHQAVVIDAADLGSVLELRVSVADTVELLIRAPLQPVPSPGTRCTVEIPSEHLHAWPVNDTDRESHDTHA